ncbi:MAG: tetratricopeptide repeat protein [Pyrinomonadaceae bacterium]
MYRNFSIIFLLSILFAGCWSSSTGTNANNSNVSNANVANVNANANQNTQAEEKVPKFDDAKTALEKGVEYLDGNKVSMAIDALKQAVELDPDLADAHFQLGVALAFDEAEKDKEAPLGDVPEDEQGKKKSKNAKEEKTESDKAFENAIKAYKKMIAKDRENHAAYFNMGRAYRKLYEDDDARKALEQAVKLNDEDANYRTELGAVLIQLAQYPSAIKQLEKALELDEANYEAEDLLEKAKAGRKRVDFGQKQQPAGAKQPSNAPPAPSSKGNGSSSAPAKSEPKSDPPKVAPPPPPAPAAPPKPKNP